MINLLSWLPLNLRTTGSGGPGRAGLVVLEVVEGVEGAGVADTDSGLSPLLAMKDWTRDFR